MEMFLLAPEPLVTTSYVIDETVTFFNSRNLHAKAVEIGERLLAGLRAIAVTVGVLLTAQVALGVSNILSGLNLAVAVGHNAGAALLLAALVVLNFVLSRGSRNRD